MRITDGVFGPNYPQREYQQGIVNRSYGLLIVLFTGVLLLSGKESIQKPATVTKTNKYLEFPKKTSRTFTSIKCFLSKIIAAKKSSRGVTFRKKKKKKHKKQTHLFEITFKMHLKILLPKHKGNLKLKLKIWLETMSLNQPTSPQLCRESHTLY